MGEWQVCLRDRWPAYIAWDQYERNIAQLAANRHRAMSTVRRGPTLLSGLLVCGKCGHREEIFDSGGGGRAAKELGVPFLGEIPIYTPIRVGSDTGRPIVVMEPESGQSQTLRAIARNLAAQVSIRQYSDFAAPDIEIRLDG